MRPQGAAHLGTVIDSDGKKALPRLVFNALERIDLASAAIPPVFCIHRPADDPACLDLLAHGVDSGGIRTGKCGGQGAARCRVGMRFKPGEVNVLPGTQSHEAVIDGRGKSVRAKPRRAHRALEPGFPFCQGDAGKGIERGELGLRSWR